VYSSLSAVIESTITHPPMSVKDSDFRLGLQLRQKLDSDKASSLRILPLLSDLAESDLSLASAFRLLGTHPVFLDFFSFRGSEGFAQLASIRLLVGECLSDALASRVNSFIDGFLSIEVESKSASKARSSHDPVGAFANSYSSRDFEDAPPEHATQFASDIGEQHRSSGFSSDVPPPVNASPSQRKKSSYLKPLIILFSLAALVLALFKVDALCEPLGLCEAKASKKESESRSETKNLGDSKPASDSALPDKQAAQPVPGNSATSSTSPRQPSPYSPPASPSEPPNREEPLW